MPTSTLRIPPDTEQVRVARLVACAAARKAGIDEDDVEEVRLAVGEAVGRAVLRHMATEQMGPVEIRIVEQPHSFEVEVVDRARGAASDDGGFAMAVITGLVPSADVRDTDEGGQSLNMVWSR